MLITPNTGQFPPGFRHRANAAFRRHIESTRRARQQRGDRLDAFSVGNFRGSRRPTIYRGSAGRRPSRASYPWQRRSGFIGNGSSVPVNVPTTRTAHLVTPPGGPPPVIPDGGAGIPIDPPQPTYPPGQVPPGQVPPTYPPAQPPPPFYPCPPGVHPLQWDFYRGCPIDVGSSMGCTKDGVTLNCESEQPCGVNVIGSNTLGTDGIPPREVVPLNVTAGDATKFATKAIYFEALPYSDADTIDVALLPPSRDTMPVILVDALVGRISQLRRGGAPDVGLPQGAYANKKELVPVDWAAFTSTTEHNLSLLFYNPNVNTPVHVFTALWGDI